MLQVARSRIQRIHSAIPVARRASSSFSGNHVRWKDLMLTPYESTPVHSWCLWVLWLESFVLEGNVPPQS